MISDTHAWISWTLIISGIGFAAAIAVPLLVAPLAWARRFGWVVPEEPRLARYLGRCLGAVAMAVLFVTLRAAPDPAAQPLVFELLVLVGAMLALVHVWGALEKSQPLLETLEIPVYAALTGVFAYVRLTLW